MLSGSYQPRAFVHPLLYGIGLPRLRHGPPDGQLHGQRDPLRLQRHPLFLLDLWRWRNLNLSKPKPHLQRGRHLSLDHDGQPGWCQLMFEIGLHHREQRLYRTLDFGPASEPNDFLRPERYPFGGGFRNGSAHVSVVHGEQWRQLQSCCRRMEQQLYNPGPQHHHQLLGFRLQQLRKCE
jgi:hypothetical protein